MSNGSDPATTYESVEAARDAAVRQLREPAAGVTLGECAERATALEGAATVEEVQAAIRGFPDQAEGAAPARPGKWLVGIFGGTEQRGRWRLGRRLRIVTVLGGVRLDLGNAEPEAPEPLITIFSLLGGVELLAPPGVPISFSGVSLLGGRSDERSVGPPVPGAPLVRVRVFAFLGGVKIKERAPRRDLLDLIRSRRSAATA